MRLLLDENVEKALLLGLRRRHPGLDVVRVVDVGLEGRSDTEILEWAAREGRVVVSRDRATLSAEAARRIEGGKPMPGLILLRRGVSVGRILEDLELLLATARPGELENAILYLPLQAWINSRNASAGPYGATLGSGGSQSVPPCPRSTGPRRARRSLSRGPRARSPGPRSTRFGRSPPPRSRCAPGSASVTAAYIGPLPGTLCYDGSCQQAAPGYYTAPAGQVINTWTRSYTQSCPPGYTGSVTVTERWQTVKYWTPSVGGLSSRGTLRFISATRDEMVDRQTEDNCTTPPTPPPIGDPPDLCRCNDCLCRGCCSCLCRPLVVCCE